MRKVKTHGQVFTPPHIVADMLDLVGYTPEKLSANPHVKILEPSFGDGAFLQQIIDRLVELGELLEFSAREIISLIDNNVYGIELDTELFVDTVRRLKKIVVEKVGVEPVFPNLVNMDALDYSGERFDYIVGNPPYVRVHHMDNTMREKIKKFEYSQGNSDLYIIFYEKFVELLKPDGEFVFITPNSWMKNASQKSFRRFLLEERLIVEIFDFGSEKVFKNASTYTAIVWLNKKAKDSYLYHHGDSSEYFPYVGGNIVVGSGVSNSTRLGDVCEIRNGLQTSADKIFVGSIDEWVSRGVEESLLVPAVKGGKLFDGVERIILFPYRVSGGVVAPLTEVELSSYSQAFSYLCEHKNVLENLSRETGVDWFLYGRSQSLSTIPLDKVVVSSAVNPNLDSISFKKFVGSTAVYSGLMILERHGGLSLDEVVDILSSREFYQYCMDNGKPIGNGWRTVSAPLIKNYPLPEKFLKFDFFHVF